jgi:hypothetical protein
MTTPKQAPRLKGTPTLSELLRSANASDRRDGAEGVRAIARMMGRDPDETEAEIGRRIAEGKRARAEGKS